MNRLTKLFIVSIVALQYPLWFGNGSVLRVWQLERQLSEKHTEVQRLQHRNDVLAAEVSDLKVGNEAIEERARNELGMIGHGELFIQVFDDAKNNK